MRIAELASKQVEWEAVRAISNGNWGVDRIQDEVDEARDEEDLYKKLIEICDIVIVATGSAGVLAQYLGLDMDAVERAIAAKMSVNEEKYGLEGWNHRDVEGSIARCRANWK